MLNVLSALECTQAKPRNTDGAQSKPKPYKLFDGGGLFLLVNPNGSKLWRLKYRFGGREKLLALGPFNLVSLKEARDKRDAAKKLLLDGIDPAAHRQLTKSAAAVTFKQVGEEWLTKKHFSLATLAKARWLFDTWLYPDLGSRPVNAVTPAELLAIVRRAEADGSHETAHRLRSRASQVFRYAIAAGCGGCQRDPAADLRGALAPTVVRNHAAITEPRAVGALLRAIDGYDGQPSVMYALRVAPHLFVRPGELRAAEWSEFDEKAKLWRIPAARTKLRAEHLVPLSKQVLAMLKKLREHTGRQRFLFPATGNSDRCMSENTLGSALRRLGYSGDQMTAHGFRAMASTLLNEQGIAPDLIELQLAHKERNKVRAAYNRAERLKERAKLMQEWSNHLDKLRTAKPREESL
jgi:integrase